MRVAIFGGSFDPPHKGHEFIVQEALRVLNVDMLFIVPAWLNPFKTKFFAPPKKRLEWIEKLWKNNNKIRICTYELQKKRAVPTIETVEYLYNENNISECFLILGADNLKQLSSWHRFEDLKDKVTFVIATRNDIKIPKNLKKLQINATISSSNFRKTLNYDFISEKIRKSVKDFYKEKNE